MKYSARITAAVALLGAAVITNPVFATIQQGATSAKGAEQPSVLFGNGGIFSEITNVLLFIIGGISVIMIVIGGLRYVISGGDAKQVDAAKNTILYAIIGIIVALLAYAAVNFVTGAFTNADGSTTSLTGGGSSSGGVSSQR